MRLSGKDENGGNRKQEPKIVRKKSYARSSGPQDLSSVSVHRKNNDKRPSLFVFTLIVLYKNLYILGISLLRKKRRFTKRIKLFFSKIMGAVHNWIFKGSRGVKNFCGNIIKRMKAPFLRIGVTYQELKPSIKRKRAAGEFPRDAYLTIAEQVLRLIWKVAVAIFSYVAPIVAAYILITVVQTQLGQTMGLAVTHRVDPEDESTWEVVAYVQNETEFEKAAAEVRGRVIDSYQNAIDIFIPYYELVVMEPERNPNQVFTGTRELADILIQHISDDVLQAYGLYIDDQFYGATTEKDALYEEMTEVLRSHETGRTDETVKFSRSVKLDKGFYPSTSVVDLSELIHVFHMDETVQEVYYVEEGDSPLLIADKTGVAYDVILEYNPGIEEDGVYVGQEIITQVARPFMSVQNMYTITYREEFDYPVREVENSVFHVSYRDVAVEGVNGLQEVTARISAIDGIEIEREILETRVIREAVEERVVVGTKTEADEPTSSPGGTGSPGAGSGVTTTTPSYNVDMTPSGSTGGFIWPTSGGRVTVPLGGYPGHTGVDIPRDPGTPVYASASGTVVKATYSGVAYGNHIIIDHGNGFQTYYAHNTELYVSVGDYVSQGQVIASVGRTGNATGNHVHFEVRENGQVRNPVNYIGSAG